MNNKTNILWIRCPKCGGKTRTKENKDTVLLKFPLFCPQCKQETIVSVVQLKMIICTEPDA